MAHISSKSIDFEDIWAIRPIYGPLGPYISPAPQAKILRFLEGQGEGFILFFTKKCIFRGVYLPSVLGEVLGEDRDEVPRPEISKIEVEVWKWARTSASVSARPRPRPTLVFIMLCIYVILSFSGVLYNLSFKRFFMCNNRWRFNLILHLPKL